MQIEGSDGIGIDAQRLVPIDGLDSGQAGSVGWRSAAGLAPPQRIRIVDDRLKADTAYRLACQGTGLLWHGDFQNARQLLNAMARRIDRRLAGAAAEPAANAAESAAGLAAAFHRKRMAQAQRARTLGMLLIPCTAEHAVDLPRAPDVRAACLAAHGEAALPYVVSLRELLGVIGAYEWRRKGVDVPALAARIHPHYGVFSPVRGEYVALVAQAPLPPALASDSLAFDIGTGTGVLAAVLARRGVKRVVATDVDERAWHCARDNIENLGLAEQVVVQRADLFPLGKAPLIVCNPPWLPGKASSSLERAIYDPDSRMLRGFLAGLSAHLAPEGEGWLILSDLAEHLGLRTRQALLAMFEQAGLRVLGRQDARPNHAKSKDRDDPFFVARAAEITSLWRLGAIGR